MGKGFLLGIDLGTSGVKIILVDGEGRVTFSVLEEYPLLTPRPGWAEQDPSGWWNATVLAITKLLKESRTDPSEIAGIGLTGQMHGSVFLDKNDQVIRPAILWCDQRTGKEAKEIEERMFQFYRLRSKVEFVPPEALGRVTKKTPMFEEKYR